MCSDTIFNPNAVGFTTQPNSNRYGAWINGNYYYMYRRLSNLDWVIYKTVDSENMRQMHFSTHYTVQEVIDNVHRYSVINKALPVPDCPVLFDVYDHMKAAYRSFKVENLLADDTDHL